MYPQLLPQDIFFWCSHPQWSQSWELSHDTQLSKHTLSPGDLVATAQGVTLVFRNGESTGTELGKAAQTHLEPGAVPCFVKVLQQALQTFQHKPQAHQSHLAPSRYLGTCLLLTASVGGLLDIAQSCFFNSSTCSGLKTI